MSNEATIDDATADDAPAPDTPVGDEPASDELPSTVEVDEPTTAPNPVVPPAESAAAGTGVVIAAISAVITGVAAGVLSFPVTCDTTFAPFLSDCRNMVGWSSFADDPSTAVVVGLVAALAAGLLVYLMVRFSDS